MYTIYNVDVELNAGLVVAYSTADQMFPVTDLSEEHLEVKNQSMFSFKTSSGRLAEIVGSLDAPNDRLIRETMRVLGNLLFPVYNERNLDYGKVANLWSPTPTSILYNAICTYVDNHHFAVDPILLIRIFLHGIDLAGVHVGTFLAFRVEFSPIEGAGVYLPISGTISTKTTESMYVYDG
jgi:hypothetical protein